MLSVFVAHYRNFYKKFSICFHFSRGKNGRRKRGKQARHAWGPCASVPRQYEILHLAVYKVERIWFFTARAAAVLKFSRGVLRNSVEFPPVAKFDASRDNDAKHDRRTPASKRILCIASGRGEGSIAKILFRIFLRVLTRCFYLAHFPEIGDSSGIESIVPIPEFLIKLCHCSRCFCRCFCTLRDLGGGALPFCSAQ